MLPPLCILLPQDPQATKPFNTHLRDAAFVAEAFCSFAFIVHCSSARLSWMNLSTVNHQRLECWTFWALSIRSPLKSLPILRTIPLRKRVKSPANWRVQWSDKGDRVNQNQLRHGMISLYTCGLKLGMRDSFQNFYLGIMECVFLECQNSRFKGFGARNLECLCEKNGTWNACV